ncbi:hypothetical protein [Brevibacillus sp. SIMBA_040]|uniref:hypothetical protein n=1 Tax=unclassified Brevibacillus TaxID=2684853 RepID=UPI00397D3AA9
MRFFEQRLENSILSSKELLTSNDLEEVMHFYKHAEYEMAFEGFLIEPISVRRYPSNFDYLEWKELGEYYQLDKDAVFDEFIWEKFMQWGKSYSVQDEC